MGFKFTKYKHVGFLCNFGTNFPKLQKWPKPFLFAQSCPGCVFPAQAAPPPSPPRYGRPLLEPPRLSSSPSRLHLAATSLDSLFRVRALSSHGTSHVAARVARCMARERGEELSLPLKGPNQLNFARLYRFQLEINPEKSDFCLT